MTFLNLNSAKLFALSSLSLLLAACGGGGNDSNTTTGGGTTNPPVVNTDLFTVKAKQWSIQPVANTSYCYDIDTQTEISCEDADWDLKFAMGAQNPVFFTNSGVSGSGTGGALHSPFDATWENLLKEKDATQAGSLPASAWSVDAYSNAFMDSTNGVSGFFEYDLFGDHRMSPNFKTYLITTDTSSKNVIGTLEKPVFAVQIYNYYQGTNSAYISIRYINTLYPNDVKTITVDATQGWRYIDLAIDQSSDQKQGNWQFAFNRYNVKLNSNIGATVAAQPAGFYTAEGAVINDKFKDANAYSSTEADLKAAAAATVTKWGSNTITSVLNPNPVMRFIEGERSPAEVKYGFFNYYGLTASAAEAGLSTAHMLKADSKAATMIRGNTGRSYARMHLKDLSYANPQDRLSATTWTFEFDIQPAK